MDIKKKEKNSNKGIKTFSIEEKLYTEFRSETKKLNLSMSEILNEFIRRIVRLLKEGKGGEVVFGVEGSNWEQPRKIIYDGKEIEEKNGTRQIKKGEDKK